MSTMTKPRPSRAFPDAEVKKFIIGLFLGKLKYMYPITDESGRLLLSPQLLIAETVSWEYLHTKEITVTFTEARTRILSAISDLQQEGAIIEVPVEGVNPPVYGINMAYTLL